jgi:hypothetical protein
MTQKKASDGKPGPSLQPGHELLPCPAIHTDLAPAAALPLADEHRTAVRVGIGISEIERFADPQPGAPQDHDQRSQPGAVGSVAAARMTATMSSTVSGAAGQRGSADPCSPVGARGGSPARLLARGNA